MDRFQALRVFVAVADERGFAAAARKLALSPPAVSRAVAELERHLGVTLLHRSTRTVHLSDEGAAFLDRARKILADLREAETAAMGGRTKPQGQLRLTAPVMFGRLHVLPVVAALLQRHPALSANLLLIDRNVRIVEEGIDVAVRIGRPADSALRATPIGAVRRLFVASPSYVARRGSPQTADELKTHDIVHTTLGSTANRWSLPDGPFEFAPRIAVNTVDATIAAAEAGLGVASLLSYQAAGGLADGRLVQVLPHLCADDSPVSLLFERSRGAMPGPRAFISAMKASIGGRTL